MRIIKILVLLAMPFPALALSEPVPDVPEDEASWPEVFAIIETLEQGTLQERIDLLNEPEIGESMEFDLLDDPDDENFPAAVDRLRSFVSRERNPWILDELITLLLDLEIEGIWPVYEPLVTHSSPTVRAKAIEGLFADLEMDAPDDAIAERLLTLWRLETHPTVRASILRALDFNDVDHDLDCAQMIQTDNDDLFLEALNCNANRTNQSYIESLIEKVTTGVEKHRKIAIGELTRAAHDMEDEHKLKVRREFETRLRRPSFSSIKTEMLGLLTVVASNIAEAENRTRLLGTNEDEAISAFYQLRQLNLPDWPELIVTRGLIGGERIRIAVLNEISGLEWEPVFDEVFEKAIGPDASSLLVLAAIRAAQGENGPKEMKNGTLYSDRDHLLPALTMLESDERERISEAARETASLLRSGNTYTITTRCGLRVRQGVVYGIVVPNGQQTVRCAQAPGYESRPEDSLRVSGLDWVGLRRHDDGLTRWVEVLASNDETCWIPETWTVPLTERPLEPDDVVTLEVDLSLEQAELPELQLLEDRGIVHLFDEGQRLIGARLELDPEDHEGMKLLRESSALTRTPLIRPVRSFLTEVLGVNASNEEWRSWFVGPFATVDGSDDLSSE